MACFTDLIGIKSECSDTTPQTSFYIDDVIPISTLENIVDSPYDSVKDLFDDKMSFAIRTLENDLYGRFRPNYKANSIIQNNTIGIYKENPTLSGLGDWKGMEVEVCNYNSYLTVDVSSITFYGTFTGTVPVLIYNSITGELLDTVNIEAVSGQQVRTTINKSYKTYKQQLNLAFVYDATSVNGYGSQIYFGGCYSCSEDFYRCNNWTRAKGITSTGTFTQSGISGAGNGGGLSVTYSLNCDHSSWLCENKNQLGLHILYRTAEEIMKYGRYHSKRFNSSTSTDLNDIETQIGLFHEDAETALNKVLENIKLPQDEMCFECKKRAGYRTMLP